MRIRYSISLWNFTHYTRVPVVDELIQQVRQAGYGIELWGSSRDEGDLHAPAVRERLKPLLDGMTVSLHTRAVKGLDEHKRQVDVAADYGAEVLVLHPQHVHLPDDKDTLDVDLAGKLAEYAKRCGVKATMENGSLAFLRQVVEGVPDMDLCLDTGHCYNQDSDLAEFLELMKPRLVHLHVQDVQLPAEADLPGMYQDHYTPGAGGVPREDWTVLADALREIDYDGIVVFEVRPRGPVQTATDARAFVESIL